MYRNIFSNKINTLKYNGEYRIFNYLDRNVSKYPNILINNKNKLLFCSNDYLNMSHHPLVINEMRNTIQLYGCGSGGTRNISGSHNLHKSLEHTMKNIHKYKDSLIFPSCYTSNIGLFSTLKNIIPNIEIFSDEKNHASIINGIRYNQMNKQIFKHNNILDLEEKLNNSTQEYKLIVVESIYSMNGNRTPLNEISQLAKKYNTLLMVDEVHSLGLYGSLGNGVISEMNLDNQVDIITGTYGKAVGLGGGYVSAKKELIDCIRNISPEFIFTTSPTPSLINGIIKSLEIINSNRGQYKRNDMFNKVHYLRQCLTENNINYLKTEYNQDTHITCIVIGNSNECMQISNSLLNHYGIYIQPINYPTVEKGGELLRITLSPKHSYSNIDYLVDSLSKILVL